MDAGKFEEAEPLLREACEAAARILPSGEPDHVFARYEYAGTAFGVK